MRTSSEKPKQQKERKEKKNDILWLFNTAFSPFIVKINIEKNIFKILRLVFPKPK